MGDKEIEPGKNGENFTEHLGYTVQNPESPNIKSKATHRLLKKCSNKVSNTSQKDEADSQVT